MVSVSSPFPLNHFKGNSVSANRIAALLGATACYGEPPAGTTTLIALHAGRSYDVISRYYGKGKLVVLLTGSDLYRDFPAGNQEALHSLELADIIAVYQEASITDVPEKFRHKVRVGLKSVDITVPTPRPPRETGLITIVGHLRATKDPFLLVEAAKGLDLRIVQLGGILHSSMEATALNYTQHTANYEWVGNKTREEVLNWLCRSHLTVNTSLIEGGANSLAEAIVCGTPVLATDIPPNVGMLGESYSGLFPTQDATTLRDLLIRATTDATFHAELESQTIARRPLFTPDAEEKAWRAILAELNSPE